MAKGCSCTHICNRHDKILCVRAKVFVKEILLLFESYLSYNPVIKKDDQLLASITSGLRICNAPSIALHYYGQFLPYSTKLVVKTLPDSLRRESIHMYAGSTGIITRSGELRVKGLFDKRSRQPIIIYFDVIDIADWIRMYQLFRENTVLDLSLLKIYLISDSVEQAQECLDIIGVSVTSFTDIIDRSTVAE